VGNDTLDVINHLGTLYTGGFASRFCAIRGLSQWQLQGLNGAQSRRL